ncbi:coagulation factor 5/8 type domain protein [Bacteroides coprosuis DSM 18011]|uniref:alpha-L-fucosidase n=1 Tax=Bacteroides coprosuis DSM 18011 TaxID=679937 RepID=F3ZPE8_9BACE|nr:alpha-L-fucosidase [Bacteroides coprosuis]EGJ71605.1 coagulation factor 5/8 type domain protein [Bacteroides coprosuis DSM 18011]
MKNCIVPIAALGLLLSGCSIGKGKSYEKHLEFPPSTNLEEKINMASRLVPSPTQLEWQQMELTAFLHFGINTFTGREWGTGEEDPSLFNPQKLNAEQWVKVLKDSGFKMALLTAKHHDGFCLWPTKTTRHSVASSPWKDGKGDVVRDLKEACDKYGLKFGVYLSPWDRNASCYGTDEYNDFFIQQLTELLTQYGDIYEVWFDGANGEGPNGKVQTYDWERILSTIKQLQPRAVTAIMGDDVRWVGNESGLGRTTEWSVTPLVPSSYARAKKVNASLGIDDVSKDLGSRELLAKANELFWYPSEVDVSIRPGWFYHPEEDHQVKSVNQLVDIYFQSVGLNSVLLLNIPPNTDGLISQSDASRLYDFSNYIQTYLEHNLVANPTVKHKVSEGNSIRYHLENEENINTLLIQEDISNGQRIEKFEIEGKFDDEWIQIAEGTTVGYKRLIRLPQDIKVEKLRLTILQARGNAYISKLGAFYCPPAEKTTASRVINEYDSQLWKTTCMDVPLSQVTDRDISTADTLIVGQEILIDLGKEELFGGFIYTPAYKALNHISKYSLSVSKDKTNWTIIYDHEEFSNIKNNPIPQELHFPKEVSARYIKLIPHESSNYKDVCSIAELGLLKK